MYKACLDCQTGNDKARALEGGWEEEEWVIGMVGNGGQEEDVNRIVMA